MKSTRVQLMVIIPVVLLWLLYTLPILKQTIGISPIKFPKPTYSNQYKLSLILTSSLLSLYLFILGFKELKHMSKIDTKKLGIILPLCLLLIPISFAYIFQTETQNITQTILNVASNIYDYVDNDTSNVDSSSDQGTSTNFNAQKVGPDGISDEISEAYITGGVFEDIVDVNTSNVDGSENIGTQSNFNAQKSGPDSIVDVLTEQNTVNSLDATGGYMLVGNGSPDWGSTSGTISFWVKWDTLANRPWGQHENMETRITGSNLVIDWGAASSLTSITSFTAGNWYFIAITWNEATDNLSLYVGDQGTAPSLDAQNTVWTSTVSTVGVTQNNFMASKSGVGPLDGHGDDLRYWNTDRSLAAVQGDYDSELSGSETNLRSYFKLNNDFDDIGPDNSDGSGSGSYSFSTDTPYVGSGPTENIRVDVWHSSAWNNVFTDLSVGWNNVTVASYLDSSTFTIRFKGGTETSDTTQDTWKIDTTLLHVWS